MRYLEKCTLSSSLLAFPAVPPAVGVRKTPANPNILTILGDEMGYSDISCYGGEIHTPHIDPSPQSGQIFRVRKSACNIQRHDAENNVLDPARHSISRFKWILAFVTSEELIAQKNNCHHTDLIFRKNVLCPQSEVHD